MWGVSQFWTVMSAVKDPDHLPPRGEGESADSDSLCFLGGGVGRIWPVLPVKSPRRPQGWFSPHRGNPC